jgi:hypothetical protein
MSWRDSASGSSSFHGGGGHAGNSGPSGAGTGASRGGGGNNSVGSRTGGLGGGLSTGNTWHGNTAFGVPGGMAQGYATARQGAGAGMGPTVNTYSNFRTPSGAPMFEGSLQGRSVAARMPQQALGMLRAIQASMQAPPSAAGGLLGDGDVVVEPTSDQMIDLRFYDPLSSIRGLMGVPMRTQSAVVGGYGVPGYGMAAGMRSPSQTQNAVVGGYGIPGYGMSSGGGWGRGPGSTHYKNGGDY